MENDTVLCFSVGISDHAVLKEAAHGHRHRSLLKSGNTCISCFTNLIELVVATRVNIRHDSRVGPDTV